MNMIISVIANFMSLFMNPQGNFRVPLYLISYQEKSGRDSILGKNIQNQWSVNGAGTIIESNCDYSFPGISTSINISLETEAMINVKMEYRGYYQ